MMERPESNLIYYLFFLCTQYPAVLGVVVKRFRRI